MNECTTTNHPRFLVCQCYLSAHEERLRIAVEALTKIDFGYLLRMTGEARPYSASELQKIAHAALAAVKKLETKNEKV